MSTLHYSDKQNVKEALVSVLSERGWTIFGFSPDQSDSMTDYYHPAHWNGVAEKDGTVLVFDVNAYDAKMSGTEIVEHRMKLGPCTPCKGTGKTTSHQDGYTTRALFAGTVEHHPAIPMGSPCKWCDGTGQREESREHPTGVRWPTFQATPKGSKWHAERNGKIIAKGVALYAPILKGGGWKGERAKRAADFLDKVLEQLTPSSSAPAVAIASAVEGVTITPGKTAGFVDVRFPSKPDADTLTALKAAGFRWAKWAGCWWGPEANLPAGLVQS